MAHSNSTTQLSAGVKALSDGASTFAHTQALWRFLRNVQVTPEELSMPVLAACHAALNDSEGDYALCMHDWSRINYGGHISKADRLQMTHATDIGYELQSSLLVDAQNGNPLSVVAQNLVSSEGTWQSRQSKIQKDEHDHLDELSERMEWIENRQFAKKLVHIVDREADSVGHLRRWSQAHSNWLIRAKAGSKVRYGDQEITLSSVAEKLTFREKRKVMCAGNSCTQWVASTNVVMTRPARSKKLDSNGKRVKPIKGVPLAVRLVVSNIFNIDGDLVAQWYLLSNVQEHVEDATIALWYYFRWEIESFFKLLKSAGHQLESWEQETARATFNRILIATQACVIAWSLMAATDETAVKARQFLVRLSGRQMKQARPATCPALLSGLFILFTMLETLEHYSLDELKEIGQVVKNQLNL